MSNSRRARRQAARSSRKPAPSLRLRESDTAVLDRPTEAVPEPTTEAVSNTPWSQFSQADYTPQQWRRACLIDTEQGNEDSKDRYSLPVREPSGTVNRNGVHAAAARINQVSVSADKKRTAARALVRLYRSELDEEPPESLRSLAGQGGSESHREPAAIHETVTEAIREAPTGSPATVDVQIIQAGWNRSGSRYYPAEVLARDVPKVYPVGTHMYLDHPTATEEAEQPERSVTRLAAVLTEAPYTNDGGRTMRARARIFAPHRDFVSEAWRDIGVSINGDGEGQWGERDGRHGLIIEALTYGRSVDFVTKAGAGGRILQLLESAMAMREARNVGAWLESRIHAFFTTIADDMYGAGKLTREERITLSGAIGDALTAFVARVDADAAHLYQRHPALDPEDGEAPQQTEVRESATEPAPVPESAPTPEPAPEPAPAPAPAPEPATETSAPTADPASPEADGVPPAATPVQEGVTPMSGDTTTTGTAPATAGTAPSGPSPEARAEIAEANLRESQARITALEAQNSQLTVERDTARTEASRLRVSEAARSTITGALSATDLPDAARTRITESIVANVPTVADGQVDTNALTARINEAIERERTYIASIREAAGEGQPNGLGGNGNGGNGQPAVDLNAVQTGLIESYRARGMSEQQAKLAATGRLY